VSLVKGSNVPHLITPNVTLGRLATFLVGQNTRVHVRTKQWTNEGSSNLGGLLISHAKYVDNNPSNQQTYIQTSNKNMIE